jgi:hypothetical protein
LLLFSAVSAIITVLLVYYHTTLYKGLYKIHACFGERIT